MADSRDKADPERLDLSALSSTDAQADRVIGAVMASISTKSSVEMQDQDDALAIVGRYAPSRWVAAALLLSAASLVIVATRRPREDTPTENMVAVWATEAHVPTNAELLTAFQGYER